MPGDVSPHRTTSEGSPMTNDETQAYADAEAAAHEGPAALLESVADKLGLHAGAKAVFGEPVERDGITVIPVAQMAIGTGAGGGTSAEQETGTGAGGGAAPRPIGYIEISADGATYVPLRKPWLDPLVLLSLAPLALIVGRTLVRLVRG